QLSNGTLDCFVKEVSSDGSKILYGSVSETSDLWSVDTRDSRQYAVANDVTEEYWGDVSPDGKSVVYQSVQQVDKPSSGAIKLRSPAGDVLSVSPQGSSPVWSRDGQRIAFFRRTEKGIGIWTIRPTGDDAVEIANGEIDVPDYVATPYL